MGLSPDALAALRQAGKTTGRLGGLARAKNMTPAQRRASALKASRAAAESRRTLAKLKKLTAKITRDSKALAIERNVKLDALEKKNRARLRKMKKAKP
jgi:hypothetical protein